MVDSVKRRDIIASRLSHYAGVLILLLGFEEPLALIVVSAALGGTVMFLYSGLLIWVNFRLLPGPIRMNRVRLVLLIGATGFYGYFCLRLLLSLPGQFVG